MSKVASPTVYHEIDRVGKRHRLKVRDVSAGGFIEGRWFAVEEESYLAYQGEWLGRVEVQGDDVEPAGVYFLQPVLYATMEGIQHTNFGDTSCNVQGITAREDDYVGASSSMDYAVFPTFSHRPLKLAAAEFIRMPRTLCKSATSTKKSNSKGEQKPTPAPPSAAALDLF